MRAWQPSPVFLPKIIPWTEEPGGLQSIGSKIGEGVCQDCILSLCLFNLYSEYIMQNAGLGESQAGIKIARRNIKNLSYAVDTTLI